MKKIILFSFFAFFVLASQAQVAITIEPNPSYATIEAGNTDVPAHAKVKNLGNVTVTYKWERIVVSLPAGMTSAVCDLNQCYLPSVSTKEFQLDAGEEGTMDVHVYPNGNTGSAEISIKVYEVGNTANTVTGSYIFSGSTATQNVNNNSFSISPNPVEDAFTLSGNTSGVGKVVLYNIIGKVVRSYNANGNTRFDVSDLTDGIYLVRLEDRSGRALKTLRLVKRVVTP